MMEFRLEERGISVKSVGVATAAAPHVVPLEGWRWTQQFRRMNGWLFAVACGGETNGPCV
jgi:hypothetical protein